MNKKSTIPNSHLFEQGDLHLYELQNIFTACALWLENGMENRIATFDLLVRDMPKNRNFLICGGIEEIVKTILEWRYTKEEIEYLRANNLATPKLIKYLSKFKFSGDIWAMPEGTIFFPGETVVRITAPICEANVLTNFLMIALFGNSIYMSKMIRGKLAAGDKKFMTAGGLRISSFETAAKASRAGYIVGADTALPAFFKKYNLKPHKISVNSYHAVIKSFDSELEAFRASSKLFPGRTRVMVDTYDFKKGIQNVIDIHKKEGLVINAINLDSGDLLSQAKYARDKFDKAGLKHIQILAYSNLNEWKIKRLRENGAPIDIYIAATEMATIPDDPKLEVVYKLAEIRDGRKVRNVAKLAKNKESYPGKKQIFRKFNKSGKMLGDIIGLENEKLGTPMLKKWVSRGKLVRKLPSMHQMRKCVSKQLETLPNRYKEIDKQYIYSVKISPKLKNLFESVKKEELAD